MVTFVAETLNIAKRVRWINNRPETVAMMRIEVSIVMALIVSTTVLLASQKYQDKITVFVKGAGTAGGFTDPSKDRQDSIKDLRKSLGESKSVRPVGSEQEAHVVLEVIDRETKRESNVMTGLFGQRQNKSYLTVRLTAGEYSAELTGESGSKGVLKGYGAAAGKVVDQLEEWAKANHDRLLALKK